MEHPSHQVFKASPKTYQLSPRQRSPSVHVILSIHDEEHLVGIQLKLAVYIAGTLHPNQLLPGAFCFVT